MASGFSEPKSISNRRLALQIIREEGPISRAEIARRLHLSRPTASRVVDALEQTGLVACTGKSSPTGGRLGELYSVRDDVGYVLGLALGTRQARAAIAKLNGEIVGLASRTLTLETSQDVLPQLKLLISEVLKDFVEPTTKILSIGVAVPGVVHLKPVAGYVDDAKIFLGLNNRPFQRELERQFGIPIAMDNDVNLAAIGECQFGCAQGLQNVAYLFVGRGIGAGLVLGGKLFRGSSGAAGEIGNMLIDRANLHHNVGTRGCLETLASIDQLTAAVQASAGSFASIEDLCEQAFNGEKHAHAIIRTINEPLALAVIGLISIIDPEMIVLGGDLAELPHANELFAQPIEHLIRQHITNTVQLCLSHLQGNATLYGAIQAAISIVLNTTEKSNFISQGLHKLLTEEAGIAD